MPRPLGSKNKTTEQREQEKATKKTKPTGTKNSKKLEDTVISDQPETVHKAAKTNNSTPAKPGNDVLEAINGLASFVQQGFQQFDQRISAMENGRRVSVTLPIAEVIQPDQAVMPVATHAISSTMEIDNTLAPPPPSGLLASLDAEADTILKSQGLDKIKPVDRPDFGRPPVSSMKDVRCVVCGRPPKEGYRVTSADFRPDADGKLGYYHEGCHGPVR